MKVEAGFECASSIEWRKWEPGKQYHKVLPIKNTSRFVQTLHWQQPDCPYFGIDFIGPVRLNPGVTAVIGLVFKPSKPVDHSTQLQFVTSKGSFSVILRALSSCGHVQCQGDLSFGSCAVNAIAHQYFQYTNSGCEATPYEWIVQPPFSISPKKGLIQPGETVVGTCYFSPDKACPYFAMATCIIRESPPTTMNINGTGKYTCFEIHPALLDFGDVVVGSAQQMDFRILNTSKVEVTVKVDLIEDCMQPSSAVFTVDLNEALIQPNEHLSVKVLYSPISAGSFSSGQVVVTSALQNGSLLTCTGYALRPAVSISTSAIDFGSSPLGSSISRSFSLSNLSKVHVSFQFVVSGSAIYCIHPVKGVIRPESTQCVHIEFRPREARNYYKRIVCIVQDQYPLYCDLVGCCYLDIVDFPTLQLSHIAEHGNLLNKAVHAHQSASFAGADKYSGLETSNELLSTVHENVLDLCSSVIGGSSVGYKTSNHTPCIAESSLEQACTAEELWEEYFLGRTQHCATIEIIPTSLEFGCIPHLQKSEKQCVVVKNNSKDAILCLWENSHISPRQDRKYNSMDSTVRIKGAWSRKDPEEIFQISPQEAILSPYSTVTFYVTFVPSKGNQFYVETVDLCIFHDDGKENYVRAPSLTSIQVSGNSFDFEQQKYIPEAYFFPSQVVFSPTLKGSRAYQTVALRNQGCTPLHFSFDTSSLSHSFSVKPMQGLVEKKSFQLISLRFEAGNPSSHILKLPCILNYNLNEKVEVTLIARSDLVQVKLEESNIVRFKPTNVGVPTDRTITLRNLSSIPAMFDWKVPLETSELFTVKPGSGIILGNQTVTFCCSFCPSSPSEFSANVSCLIAALVEKATYTHRHGAIVKRSCGPEVLKLSAAFQGKGMEGCLRLEPQQLELGTILVGFPQRQKLTVSNCTEGSVNYVMNFTSLEGTNNEDYRLRFDHCQGSIPANSTKDVNITFKPKTVSIFRVRILCNVQSSTDLEGGSPRGVSQCILSAKALFPSLIIAGARGEGFSQAQAWCRLQLEELESLLAKAEYKQHVGLRGCQDLFGLGGNFGEQWNSSFKFLFGRGHVATKPTVFVLVLSARNDLPVSWKIRLWNDKEVDLENWVEEAEPRDEKELLYMTIREQGLIQVFPREGHLNPKEHVQIKFIYRHYIEGTHNFPAILHIKNGCSLPITFCGETLPREASILTLEAGSFVLRQVEVGHTNPPSQSFELRNDGNSQLRYSVDLSPLQCLQQESYGFEVLRCLNPVGSIPPNETLLLNWMFQPIEAKNYAVDVFISVEDGEGAMLSIQGTGIDKRQTRSNDQPSNGKGKTLHPVLTSCQWVGLPAMLTAEHLCYENVSAHSSVEKLVAVKNLSEDSRVSFSWHCSYAADNSVYGHFSVTPSQGVIECGGSCLCKMTFTAGIQPQFFDTTLYCRIHEVISEHVNAAADRQEEDNEIFAQQWERLGSEARKYDGKEHHEHALSNLTWSTNQRLPRLSAKGPLRFPSSATIKPLTDDVQGTRSEQIKKNKGVLYLTVSGSIRAAESLQRKAEMSSVLLTAKDASDGKALEEQLLVEMLGEAMQEVVDARVVETRLQSDKALFFEQYSKTSSFSRDRYLIDTMMDGSSDGMRKIAACTSACEDGAVGKREPLLEESIDVFDLAKVMLEFMLFDIIKEFHDSNKDLSSLGSSEQGCSGEAVQK